MKIKSILTPSILKKVKQMKKIDQIKQILDRREIQMQKDEEAAIDWCESADRLFDQQRGLVI